MTPSTETNKAAALCAVGAVLLCTASIGIASDWARAALLIAGVIALLCAAAAYRRQR